MKQILFFLFLSVSAFAQQTFYLKDKATDNPIAYASIYNEIGTFKINSESDGSFIIPVQFKNDMFIIESIGYELMQTNLDNSLIYLNDKAETLDEMIIIPRLRTKEIKIGNDISQKSSKFPHSNQFISGSNLKFGMKFFVDNTEYSYLKEILLKTKSKIKDAKFEIRIYDVNEKGEPGQLIHDKPIYGIAKKGTSVTKINLEQLQLNSNSFFVFFEPIFINENTFNKNQKIYYAPEIYQSNVLENAMWLGYKLPDEQQWNPNFSIEHQNRGKNIYLNFQIEVILTN